MSGLIGYSLAKNPKCHQKCKCFFHDMLCVNEIFISRNCQYYFDGFQNILSVLYNIGLLFHFNDFHFVSATGVSTGKSS